MNMYRVDVSDNAVIVPAGMNSIRYIGDSWQTARKVFDTEPIHKDSWNQPNERYGVILSVWNGTSYVVKCSKGFK